MAFILETVKRWTDQFQERHTERKLYHPVPIDHVINDPNPHLVSGSAFEPESSYYSVRIAELNLRNTGEYFRDFLPMVITLADFNHGGELRSVPYFLNNDKLRQEIGPNGDELGLIEVQNVYVMRHIPTDSDGLSLFCGMFRTVHHNFASVLFDLLAEVTEQMGGGYVAKASQLAQTVYSRLDTLLGRSDVEFRFGRLDGSALAGKSGYRIIAGVPEAQINKDALYMKEGRLHWREPNDKFRAVDEFDYCVIALEHLKSRAEIGMLTSLGLHKYWKDVVPFLSKNQLVEAEAKFQNLQSEILITPDLTEMDRLAALAAYQKQWVDIVNVIPRSAGSVTSSNTRAFSDSFRKSLLDAQDAFQGSRHATVKIVTDALRTQLAARGSDNGSSRLDALETDAKAIYIALQGVQSDASTAAELAGALAEARARSRLKSFV